ncbi:pentatricopeptide repeat-containing protein At5g06540-like [Phoenix dactylifera]|uniref:Pentatricopeptide repeat-containing protein At5g06540-like n=1 Tax=Phoenix dactylifera TaxID=42345 RepID=A0A8B7BIC9_PHODC|nr:pentatricopeptide repeat-containing protein At5g06540-like [Phoenix dactylifera]
MSHRNLPSSLRQPCSDFLASVLSFLYSSSPSFSDLRRAHGLLIVFGAAFDKLVARRLVALYCRRSAGALDYALLLHSHLRHPDPVASNLILKNLVRRAQPSDVIAFYCRQAHLAGCRPSRCTFPLLVTAVKLRDSIHEGEAFHCLAIKLGFLSHLPIPNSLLHMYASCDGLTLARQLFDEMLERDRISYNSLIDGYVKSGDLEEAERLFWSTPDRNVVSWSTLFNGYVRNRMFQNAVGFFHQMQEIGVEPDSCSVVSLLSMYALFKSASQGKSVHGFVVRRWLHLLTPVSTALVDFYCKCGLLDAAVSLFERIPKKDLICWNSLISGLGSCGRGQEALGFFSQMLHEGVQPDDITFIGILVACAHSGLVDEGQRYFKMMSSVFGIKPSFAHYWCLVDLSVRAQKPNDALKIIQDMPLDNQSAIWGAVIWLAKVHGDISVGEFLGKRLIELEPDNSRRYLPLVNVYAAASRWDKYNGLQELMKARGLKNLPDCTLIDLNVVVHKFLVGDKSQHEIQKIYGVLKEIAEQLTLQPSGAAEDALTESM